MSSRISTLRIDVDDVVNCFKQRVRTARNEEEDRFLKIEVITS
ncbi:MAG: hypothetical protein QXT69_06735 [Fervidicoccaceae archaeon]